MRAEEVPAAPIPSERLASQTRRRRRHGRSDTSIATGITLSDAEEETSTVVGLEEQPRGSPASRVGSPALRARGSSRIFDALSIGRRGDRVSLGAKSPAPRTASPQNGQDSFRRKWDWSHRKERASEKQQARVNPPARLRHEQ